MPDLSNEFQLNLPRVPSTADPTLILLLQPVYDAIHILSQYLDGINPASALTAANTPINTLRKSAMNRMVLKCNSNIIEGAPVYFSLVAGEVQATLAQAAAAATLAMGFCSNVGGATVGNYAEFTPAMGIARGTYVAGTKYYLQNAGGYGVAPGTINQCLGVALTTTDLLFMLGIPQ